jgi:hypothetical protein
MLGQTRDDRQVGLPKRSLQAVVDLQHRGRGSATSESIS